MYEFELIYSEDLGLHYYTDRNLHCCFNIYKRPKGKLNQKPNFKLSDIEIREYRRNGSYKKPNIYDIGFCSWGASLGKETKYIGEYAQELYIVIKNKKYREKIIRLIKETNWKELYPYVSTPKIQAWKVYKYISEQIPELQ